MSYQVLARKYRPAKFQDFVGQEHIVKTIVNSLREDRLGHAYIFSGTRGIGKTTIARIFAKALRCETRDENQNPCGECSACQDFDSAASMNVVEIDGASNNSVDDVRELISNISYLPSSGKYKVYIIDEVHMLSNSAFNALLKTLEEPPEHAVFLMATTEPEKLLGTVLSRCQRFDFVNATVEELKSHIIHIAQLENIVFANSELIETLAKLGNGSFRDTLSLFDQVLSFSFGQEITEDIFAQALGIAKLSSIKTLIDSTLSENIEELTNTFNALISQNISLQNIVKSLLENLFSIVIAKDFNDKSRVLSKVDGDIFDRISRAELYWVYETLAKDFSWTLESIIPTDATLLAMRKVALRHQIIADTQVEDSTGKPKAQVVAVTEEVATEEVQPQSSPTPETEVEEALTEEAPKPHKIIFDDPIEPQKESSEETQEPEVDDTKSIEDEVVIEGPKSWDGFLQFLAKTSPVMGANMEQGNLIGELVVQLDKVSLLIGYPTGAKVFFDHMNNQETLEKVREHLRKYFQVQEIDLSIELVEKKKAEETDFKSKFEINIENENIEKQNQRKEIEGDEMLQLASSIFNSKIDKIILNEDE
ncbi:DNA polymerase III, subunit gamma and tau [Bacteriovorax sp. BAL6_X]|uniref:DNA polymerase III subunit gamma/tau n=1 Tax=Bacteriovorax sp. BAL6_X TaxID=1201290 RepID=UPI0003866BBC|nr:DNA polymerase III subunit gamma/tau [Bacteriovorax sp. BAL6_X]EPZ50410.1 DNA polymerase III, subunit gamma and tau [Bacteriovorax sp. BAL6_X]